MTIESKVFAKLNLSLAVTGRRDGLHTLDMIVYPYEKYEDRAVFSPVEGQVGFDVAISGGFDGLDKGRFLSFAQEKFDAVAREFGVGGKLEIHKGIPLGAGMGGSSATIACVMKSAAEYLHRKGQNTRLDTRFLLSLGSDVPYMIHGGVCRVSGVGEVIEELPCEGRIDVEEIIAAGGSDSGKCYAAYDALHGDDYDLRNIPTSVSDAIRLLRNDLFESACMLNPQIKTAYDELKRRGFDKVLMSGSGSTVFAIKGFVK